MKYDCLLPCQNLMAESVEIREENGKYISRYACKSSGVKVDILGDPERILCDVIDKTCRKYCPAIKGNNN